MTTPERLRRRQVRNDWFIAVLAILLAASVAYFRLQDDRAATCFRNYVAQQTQTSKIRSGLVEQESLATRTIISSALTAESREDIVKARAAYFTSLARIDEARDDNPILPPFDPGKC